MNVSFPNGKATQIAVDSGAEENVCPWEWGEQFETKNVSNYTIFWDASGNPIEHYGKRAVIVTSPN